MWGKADFWLGVSKRAGRLESAALMGIPFVDRRGEKLSRVESVQEKDKVMGVNPERSRCF